MSSGIHTSIINRIAVPQTKYNIYQGQSDSNKTLIGYAILEMTGSVKPTPKLIITNTKNAPVSHTYNFRSYTLSPLEKIVITSGKKRLDKPVEAIRQITKILITNKKI